MFSSEEETDCRSDNVASLLVKIRTASGSAAAHVQYLRPQTLCLETIRLGNLLLRSSVASKPHCPTVVARGTLIYSPFAVSSSLLPSFRA